MTRRLECCPPPLRSARGSNVVAGSILALLACGMVACGGSPASQFNRSASLTSIGPLRLEGSSLIVDYTLRDAEGDDQTIRVGVCEGERAPAEPCPEPVEGAPSDGRSSLPTVPRDEDVSHQFAWNLGCGRVADGRCLATDPQQSYLVRIRLVDDESDQTVVSEAFSLADSFGVDSVPACDRSANTVPEPCPPSDDSSP